jgi:2-polyprenyl-6-methoxyphenol hydroxylase-like FAD-dependent oxidoreductase
MSGALVEAQRDVVVVGAGLAGAATAAVLARRGLSVTVVDPYADFPPLFRAEKIEPSQAALFRELGLFEGVEPASRPIKEIIHGMKGRIVYRRKIDQFGIAYRDIVNCVRAQMPSQVDFRYTRVDSIASDPVRPSVVLADGARIECRLAVVASGMHGDMPERLGMVKGVVKANLSTVFGFMLERPDGKEFAFDAVTYKPESTSDGIGYLTLFRMGQYMRANLFTYVPARDPVVREMLRQPVTVLQRVLPGLAPVVGRYGVPGKVEVFNIDLYRMRDCLLPGVVLLGDAFQSVCPSTGMGMSKVLTDVNVLCNACLPGWLSSGAIGPEQLAAFYAHPGKAAIDDRAMRMALDGRDSVLDVGVYWRLRRHVKAWRFATGW